jgi:hypothetical protein
MYYANEVYVQKISNLEMLKKTSGIKDVKEERKDAFSTYVSSHEQQRYHRK